MITLTKAEVENFKGIADPITVNIAGDVFYVIGSNGSGKSSFLDALLLCITGKTPGLYKKDRWQLKKGGKPSKIGVTLHDSELGCDIVIRKKILKSRTEVTIEASDGRKIDAGYIENLLSQYTWDLSAFIQASGKEQAEILNIDTSEYDAVIAQRKEEQSDVNKKKLAAMAAVRDMEKHYGKDVLLEVTPAVDTAELSKIQQGFLKQNFEAEKAAKLIEDTKGEIQDVESRIKELSAKLENFRRKLKNLPDPVFIPEEVINDTEDKIQGAEDSNARARWQQEYRSRVSEADKYENAWRRAGKAASRAEAEKIHYLSGVSLPEDAGITETGELVVADSEGSLVPLKETHLNTAWALKAAINVLQATVAPKCPIYLVRGGGLLDRNSLGEIPLLKRLHENTGAQIICELVTVSKPKGASSVKMEEGKVSE